MDAATLEPLAPCDEARVAGAKLATSFLLALFDEQDTILLRPIETWIEDGRKRSRVDYRHTSYPVAKEALLRVTIVQLLKLAETEHVNLFFGVCPRVGAKGRFDLAWQIRTVRVLWTDIDNVTVDEARERVVKAGLPAPSIIVNSGSGVHLYWLLEVAYLIDDAGEPPSVKTEWVKMPDGRRKPRKYYVEDGDRLYLDQRRHVSRLNPKAQHAQDVLSGIAQAVGGDHTTDLSRLLRIPGSWNRKDQRNGREPVPTALVEFEPSRRYPLSAFEAWKSASPETEQARKIAAMPLPRPRKLSDSKADKLSELVATCAVAPAGSRSEADFGLCCFAIRSGISKEDVWAQVESIGKFAEQGRRYFDLTWDNAEFDFRAGLFDKLQERAAPKPASPPDPRSDDDDGAGDEPPDEAADGEASPRRPTITIDPMCMPVADSLHKITDRLLAAGDCFIRADQLVVITSDQVSAILSSSELAGLLNQHVEFYFIDEEGGEYKPLPPPYANTWLHNRLERARVPTIKLFTRNPVYTYDWRLVAPGFDADSGIYYAGPVVAASNGTKHLDALLADFCFKKPADRTNYLAMLLTAVLVPHFIGSKPAALFNSNQPELGKSILAQIIAILRDGHTTETATYNPNDEEFEKRLGAIVRRGVTTIIVDNAKGRGREPRIESACLERSITDHVLSFRLLGHSAEIRAENSHIFCITANAPDVSRDLITRSVVINLFHEGDPTKRSFTIDDIEGYAIEHRVELLGELIGMVERWKAAGMPRADVHSRFNKRCWGTIVGGILEANSEPDFLANAEEAALALDETRRDFAVLVGIMANHPQGNWTAAGLVGLAAKHSLLAADLGEGTARSLATKMGAIAGRYLAEPFELPDGRRATFERSNDRNGSVYRVEVTESAEP